MGCPEHRGALGILHHHVGLSEIGIDLSDSGQLACIFNNLEGLSSKKNLFSSLLLGIGLVPFSVCLLSMQVSMGQLAVHPPEG